MPAKVKLVVLATGDLAIPVVEAAMEAGHEVVDLMAHPARSSEESVLPEERQGSALAGWAKKNGLKLRRSAQPGSDRVRRQIEELEPDLGLVVAYGRGFPTSLLEVPTHGWIKVHYSLLPKYRGLHPIRAAIWHGERQTGASVIQVTEERDAGPILGQEKLTIDPDETFGELAPRVAEIGADLVAPAIRAVCRSKPPKARKQSEKRASKTPRFGRRHRSAPWWREAKVVYDRLRSLSPEPGMTTSVKGKQVRILKGAPADHVNSPIGETGSFIGFRSGSVAVLCGNGTVFGIDRVQVDDREPTTAVSFFRELGLRVGRILV